jgi:hypothetical protein
MENINRRLDEAYVNRRQVTIGIVEGEGALVVSIPGYIMERELQQVSVDHTVEQLVVSPRGPIHVRFVSGDGRVRVDGVGPPEHDDMVHKTTSETRPTNSPPPSKSLVEHLEDLRDTWAATVDRIEAVYGYDDPMAKAMLRCLVELKLALREHKGGPA